MITSETGIGKHDLRSVLVHPMLSDANHIRRLHASYPFSRAFCVLQERFLVLESCGAVPLHLHVSIRHRVKTFSFLHFCSGVEAVQIAAKDRYGNSAEVSLVISVTIEPSGAVPDGTILPMLEHSPVQVTLNGGLAKLPRLTLCARVGNYIGDYLLVFSAPGVESHSVKFAFSTGESLTFSVSLVVVLLDKHSTKTERESIETDYSLST